MADFRQPTHIVHGAASYLKTLQVPTKDSTVSGLLGALWLDQSNLHFWDGSADRSILHDNTSFGGDISGVASALVVGKIKGVPVTSAAPTDTFAITFDGNANQFVYSDVKGFGSELVTAEASARAAADTALQAAIDAEVTNRAAADTAANTALSNEQVARQSADTTLQSNIDAEVTARQGALTAEASARAAADTALQAAIDAEVTNRAAADTALQAAIDAEASARAAADTALQSNIDAEASARAAGDLASQTLAVNGDLSGSLPNPSVVKIQGVSVAAGAPSVGQVLKFNGASAAWTSPSAFSADFVVADFVADGSQYNLTLTHGITLVGNKLPQITVYEVVGGKNLLVGGVECEVSATEVVLTVAGNARFNGSLHLLYI